MLLLLRPPPLASGTRGRGPPTPSAGGGRWQRAGAQRTPAAGPPRCPCSPGRASRGTGPAAPLPPRLRDQRGQARSQLSDSIRHGVIAASITGALCAGAMPAGNSRTFHRPAGCSLRQPPPARLTFAPDPAHFLHLLWIHGDYVAPGLGDAANHELAGAAAPCRRQSHAVKNPSLVQARLQTPETLARSTATAPLLGVSANRGQGCGCRRCSPLTNRPGLRSHNVHRNHVHSSLLSCLSPYCLLNSLALHGARQGGRGKGWVRTCRGHGLSTQRGARRQGLVSVATRTAWRLRKLLPRCGDLAAVTGWGGAIPWACPSAAGLVDRPIQR